MKTHNTNATIEVPASVFRLAKQFDKDPMKLAERIMRAGIEAIDDAIGDECKVDLDPLVFMPISCNYSYSSYFTITGIIERMPADELADCQREADECQQTLQEIVHERATRCANLEDLQ